ncbi:hypothetical protein AJ79_09712 [Helicocarpus griseus UAMH5409]|uniref:Uncharacterized protein n=1 Tax=Helicocarpus griseus UAMH5409 TaxID=1447875 RepID=A0A2B7WHP2_9EURO|nr:hypothetical protein AJ79_09712 [Helicocarpus griseus UAMH5409]
MVVPCAVDQLKQLANVMPVTSPNDTKQRELSQLKIFRLNVHFQPGFQLFKQRNAIQEALSRTGIIVALAEPESPERNLQTRGALLGFKWPRIIFLLGSACQLRLSTWPEQPRSCGMIMMSPTFQRRRPAIGLSPLIAMAYVRRSSDFNEYCVSIGITFSESVVHRLVAITIQSLKSLQSVEVVSRNRPRVSSRIETKFQYGDEFSAQFILRAFEKARPGYPLFDPVGENSALYRQNFESSNWNPS